jgi:hypothetical protein
VPTYSNEITTVSDGVTTKGMAKDRLWHFEHASEEKGVVEREAACTGWLKNGGLSCRRNRELISGTYLVPPP